MTNFAKRHLNIASVVSVILFFAMMAVLSALTGCKSSHQVVTIVTTDTLHVYHHDTLKVVHNDTIREVITKVVHDSIVRGTIIKEVVNEVGDVIRSEKETNNEVWHNSDTNSQLTQHTVDSLVQAKVDSIYNSKYNEKPVIVEVEKPTPWYKKTWNWIVNKFAYLMGTLAFFLFLYFWPDIRKVIGWIISARLRK